MLLTKQNRINKGCFYSKTKETNRTNRRKKTDTLPYYMHILSSHRYSCLFGIHSISFGPKGYFNKYTAVNVMSKYSTSFKVDKGFGRQSKFYFFFAFTTIRIPQGNIFFPGHTTILSIAQGEHLN